MLRPTNFVLTSWHLFYVETYKRDPPNAKSIAIWQSFLTLDVVSSWATCVTILKLDGHSFFFYFRSLCTLTDLLMISQIEDPNQSLMYTGRSVNGCCPLASRRSQWDRSPQFFCMLAKGCSDYRLSWEDRWAWTLPRPLFPVGGPPVSLCACRNLRRPKLMGFRLLNYGAVDLTVAAVYAYGLKVIFELSVRILVRDRGVRLLGDRK